MKKLFFSSLLVSLALGAGAVTNNGATLSKYSLPAGWVQNMSDNGLWAVWQPYSYGETDAYPDIVDVAQGKMVRLPLTDQEQIEEGRARMCDITNDGKTIVGFFSNQPAYYRDGVWTKLPLPTGKRRWEGEVCAVSADGKVMAGWINNSWMEWYALIWKQNDEGGYTLVDPAKIPNYEKMVEDGVMSESRYNQILHEYGENALPYTGAHQVSGDGKWVSISVNRNNFGGGYFLFNTETEEPFWVQGQLSREFVMSNNGRYLLMNGQYDQDGEEANGAFLYDTETHKTTSANYGEIVDNMGNVYCTINSNPVGGVTGDACMYVNGEFVDLADVLKQKYDIDFYGETGLEHSGRIVSVSDDSKTLITMPSMVVDAASVTLPVTFDQAFQGINVLQEWQASPVSGLTLAHIGTVAVLLNRDAQIKNGAKAYVKHGDEVIAESTSISYGNNTSRSLFRIDFPIQNFAEGETYNVVVPEGTFYIPGSASANPEIVLTYKGRADGPVKPMAVTPEDGSYIVQLDMNNAIGIRYNTEIMLGNPTESAAIYEKGNTAPLSMLEPVILNGRMLALYSALGITLPEGTEYEVRIPANMVVDMAGFCGNEAMTLNYMGAYSKTIGNDPRYFSENFDDPNNARNRFLFFEGDHREPVAEMADWGFDRDNNPWNFSVRDDSEYNYCAASHSMYVSPGQSDDWMVIPQFQINGKSAFLSFKGQSYRKSANDHLKIYVWECDKVYNSLSRDIINSIREEGTLVFDERLTPGTNEATLAGDWVEYRVELGDFDKKSVYICFLNENDSQSAIFVDDVLVDSEGSFNAGTTVDSYVIGLDEIEIPAQVVNRKDGELKHLKATLTNPNGFTSVYEADINLAKDETHSFVFPDKLPLEKGKVNRYNISFVVDDEELGSTGTIKDLTRKMDKKVVIEETTGAWCGNCPMGTIAFEEIEKRHPGQLVAIAVHDGDAYELANYSQFLATGGDPNGRVNRAPQVVHPLPNMMLTSATGDQSWYDLFIKEISSPAECEIKVTKATYSPEDNQMQAKFDVEFAVDQENLYYNVFTVVLENNLPISQHNYFSDPSWDGYDILGEWRSTGTLGSQGEYARTYANHVARGYAGLNVNGESGHLPREVEAGKVYTSMTTFEAPTLREAAPSTGEKMQNVSIACIVLNAVTGNIINADVAHNVEIGIVGINDIEGEATATIAVKVIGGVVYANGSAENVEVYNIQGLRVANEGLSGLYIVRAYDEAGNSVVEKIMVR